MNLRWVILAATVLLLQPHAAVSDTHYVSKTGSNTFPYASWSTAADTVARAVEAASEWDTILIGPGHFVTDIIHMKRGQILSGLATDSTILDTFPFDPISVIHVQDSCRVQHLTLKDRVGASGGIFVDENQSIIIRQVHFAGLKYDVHVSSTNYLQSGRICLLDSCILENFVESITGFEGSLAVRHCQFYFDNTASSGAIYMNAGDLLLENSRFIAYDADTSFFGGPMAVRTYYTDPIVIRNCLLYSNLRGFALQLNLDGSSSPMSLAIIENNTFDDWNVHLRTQRPGWIFRNNILYKCLVYPLYPNNLPISTYNVTWDNSPWDGGLITPQDTIPNDLPGNSNNRNLNPMFQDEVNYLLQNGSPCLDAGDPVLLDADGTRSDVGYTGGPGGTPYTHLDLSPEVPKGLDYTFNASTYPPELELTWLSNQEADLGGYEVQVHHQSLPRDTTFAIVVPSPETTLTFTDTTLGWETEVFTFDVRSYDQQGNKSAFTETPIIIAAGSAWEKPTLPNRVALLPSYPNPFNASTRVRFSLPQPTFVQLSVCDVMGRRVRSLLQEAMPAGDHGVLWNGRNDADGPVGSGIYFLVLEAGAERQVRKALLLK